MATPDFHSPDEPGQTSVSQKVGTNEGNVIGQIQGDAHFYQLTHEELTSYVDGVRTLHFDYAARIENFLNEYLGTPDHPVAYGGREAEHEKLDAWLDDKEIPYLMLAAPAGRGKSALLVQWSHQIQKREEIEIAFVPVSIRFRTNLSGVVFAVLAARLAKLHGEEIKEISTMTAEFWRGQVTEYLRRPLPSGKKLLVIIDGLDEAADWRAGPDLFPNNPLDKLKVLCSARFQTGDADAMYWLRRLGWDNLGQSLDLTLLSEDGLREVLFSMGFPIAQLSERVNIVKELFRLSEGDPLLVQLYTQDLWKKKKETADLKPEDLRNMKPGLKGYFDRWWAQQESLWEEKGQDPLAKEATEALLDLLAFALGPLLLEDIMQLIGDEFRLHSSNRIAQALKPLSRLVIGDGIEQGFIYSHPRLGYYFLDKKTKTEKKRWENCFLKWGKEAVKSLNYGDLNVKEVSAYLIQFYGAHLERADADVEDRMHLVHRNWCNAWRPLMAQMLAF